MKKVNLMMMTLMMSLCFISFGQWTYKTVINDFDPNYKIAYTKTNNGAFLKLEKVVEDEKEYIKVDSVIQFSDTMYKMSYPSDYPNGKYDTIITNKYEYEYKIIDKFYISFYISGGYYCGDYPIVDIVFITSSGNKNFSLTGNISNDRKTIFFDDNLMDNYDFKNNFKNCSKIKLRVNDDVCGTLYYEFIMSGSTAALNFISK